MKCQISYKAWQKMQYYIQNVNAEISGWGKTEISGDVIRVLDVVIFKQSVTGASTALDHDARALFIMELKRRGESLENWNLWWHSHNTMKTFWSGTDDQAVKDEIGSIPFLLSIVSNKAKDILTRVDFTMTSESPLPVGFVQKTIDKVETEIEPIIISDDAMVVYDKLSEEYAEIENKIKELNDALSKKIEEVNELVSQYENDEELENQIKEEIKLKVSLPYESKKPGWLEKALSKELKYNRFDDEEYFNGGFNFDFKNTPGKETSKYIENQFKTDEETMADDDFRYKITLLRGGKIKKHV